MTNFKELPLYIDRNLYEPLYKKDAVIHISGLGDVGGTLVSGLRLVGGEYFKTVGLFDLDINKVNRWKMEAGQIYIPGEHKFPEIVAVSEDNLFHCDIFAFCVTAGVPPMDFQGDVRMYQLEKNLGILSSYIRKAIDANFKGLFAIVSDPVDHLCLGALKAAQDYKNDSGYTLSPLQIRGYGLGVMYARALYYSHEKPELVHFSDEGRAYGPHGEGLVIANSIEDYDQELSLWLTEKTRSANLRVRETGFKPYIAPAFSSACLSIIATVSGDWHYSAVYLNGAYLGIKNRTNSKGTIIENLPLPDLLVTRIMEIHSSLKGFFPKVED